MKKSFLYLISTFVLSISINAQTRGTKLGYIDMEYILENVTDYSEAKIQLDQKAQKWKTEVDVKNIEINKLKDALKAEKVLLTKELIEERETEIRFLENQNLEYQQKRFGANGDLIIQKATLINPIQDQVFTAVQDIAERQNYDFIFDKTSDLTMLFAANRFDISEQVLRMLNRTDKREQLSKKQQKELEAKENKEDAIDENPALAQRQKLLDERKATRDQTIEDRKLLQEQKKKEFDDKRKQILEDREAKKNNTAPTIKTNETSNINADARKQAIDAAKQKQADAKAKTLEDRKKIIEDRKKEIEERKKKTLQSREALKNGTVSDSTKNDTTISIPAAVESNKSMVKNDLEAQAQLKAKTLEDRKKIIEERKKQLEERRKKTLEDREAIKKAKEKI
ncbi:periplasmic chaperone for outer membrane proteins Skp [Flavobacterium segetis]|uniref:Periplasmic chaperone for outer membrane proteins Skp n=1 Tax=Flavobacterium segetis TaxID=271157 RepID=A0A1M5EYH2_9FLAO|nr:OmpH family outer membrane protein [Flavobacterium segetis]SHF84196.1 periplasmic chaperone for outer membrane proteins Skp [Flavobacterium segetis]